MLFYVLVITKFLFFVISGQYNYKYVTEEDNVLENIASEVLDEASASAEECIKIIDDCSDGAVIDPNNQDLVISHSRHCNADLRSMSIDIINLIWDCKERLVRAHSLFERVHPGFLSRLKAEKDRPRFEEILKKRKLSSINE
jgi:hypothetical protein